METKRNDIIEFAIGTKIEYNGKLYKVVEQKYCDECSIATICANSDKTDANPTKVLSKNKRLSVFGECSGIVRSDGKSVVFKEIPMNKSDNNTINSNIIQPLVEADGTVKDLQIKVPTNFKIDVEASDLDKGIIRFKNKWLSLEQLYKLAKESHYLTNRSAIKEFRDGKLVALANLMDISRYFNGDWNYDVNQDDVGYLISYDRSIKEPCYNIHEIDSTIDVYYGNPVFKNKADAQYVIDNPNFRNILDKIFKV